MIVFIGDIHANFKNLAFIVDKYKDRNDVTFVQVGDFGFFPYSEYEEMWYRAKVSKPVYFIDGNHDHNARLLEIGDQATGPVEVWHGAWYIPRGHIMDIDGKTIAFMGGAGSVDYKWRHPYIDWWPEEQIRERDVDTLFRNLGENQKIDYLVTHTPSNDCIQANFDSRDLETYFSLSRHWRDPSAIKIEEIAKRLSNPPVISGHMHRTVKWANNIILNIQETLEV